MVAARSIEVDPAAVAEARSHTASRPTLQALRPDGSGLPIWWSTGWLLVVGVGAVLIGLAGVGPTERALTALALGALPALAGFWKPRSRVTDIAVIGVWALATGLAAMMTGGAGSPLSPWLLSPMAAALVRRDGSLLRIGAVASLAGIGLAALGGLTLDVPAPGANLELGLGLVALVSTAVGLGAGLAAFQLHDDAEAMRRERRAQRVRQVLDDQPHQLFSLAPDGTFLAIWGPGQHGTLNLSCVGGAVRELASGADRTEIDRAVRRAHADGFAEIAFTPAHDAQGWLVLSLRKAGEARLTGMLRDGRPERLRRADVEEAKAEAEAQNAGKSRFLANMSHELRTPLNAIMGFSDIMRQKLFGALPDRYAEYADLIHESGSHLLELINDVLDMSKIEAERFELAREEFDARDAVSAVLRLMRGQADRAGVSLRGLLPKEELEVNADRRALKQITLNLISNALKFTPRGGSVTLTVRETTGQLELIVADTGVGISREDLARLGRPYEQAGDAEQRSVGTGLGLSLVRAFAELHGGTMTIESRLGTGTAVTVTLPVMLAPVEAPQPEPVA